MKKFIIVIFFTMFLLGFLVKAETVEECKNRVGYILGGQGADTSSYGAEKLKECESINNSSSYNTTNNYNDYTCDSYGSHSYSDGNGKCKCESGYGFITDNGKTECKSLNDYCHKQIGWSSSYNSLSDNCECDYGYTLVEKTLGGYECKYGRAYCDSNYGDNSNFNNITKKCECNEGYTINDGECVKKQNNVYFHLDTYFGLLMPGGLTNPMNNFGELVDYEGNRYMFKLDFFSCNTSNIEEYDDKDIVVNLGTNFDLEVGDKIVMQDHNDSCDITYILPLSKEESLIKCYMLAISLMNNKGMKCDCPEGNNSGKMPACSQEDENMNELQSSITWMYNHGLTSFDTVKTFNGEGYLTREEASKFFVQFSKIILGKKTDTKQIVKLSDLSKADKTLQPFIIESNQLGLFKGSEGKFYPFNKLTQAQAIAVVIRSSNGMQDESGFLRYSKYYDIANNYGLLDGLGFDYNALDSANIKRKEIALMLYRLGGKIKR